jgi:hypothetical protein
VAQHFSRHADRRLRLVLLLGIVGVVGAALLAFVLARSDRAWAIGRPAPQPIPFSHALHAGGLGLDCRYCHAGVERGADAGMPTAALCLGCHAEVWNSVAVLAPLTDSLALGAPIAWFSVHRLPDHVRFHHGAHIAAGAACETCHGRVWEMPRTVKVRPMSMGWCLDCHRAPEARLRPVEAVFDRDWRGDAGAGGGHRPGAAAAPHGETGLSPLTQCSTCHR